MNNLLTSIMTKISGSSLSSDVGGRVYLDQAPDGAELPYIVFFIVSDVPEDTFKNYLDEILIQFSLFSSSSGATEITTMYSHLKSLFDDAALSITGNTHIWMVRQNLTTMIESVTTAATEQSIRHWAVDYSIMVEKN
jgi:hypothetical protein